jgi:hypothetical protein
VPVPLAKLVAPANDFRLASMFGLYPRSMAYLAVLAPGVFRLALGAWVVCLATAPARVGGSSDPSRLTAKPVPVHVHCCDPFERRYPSEGPLLDVGHAGTNVADGSAAARRPGDLIAETLSAKLDGRTAEAWVDPGSARSRNWRTDLGTYFFNSSINTGANYAPAPRTTQSGTPMAVPRATMPAHWVPNSASPTPAPTIPKRLLVPRLSQPMRITSCARTLTTGQTTLLAEG